MKKLCILCLLAIASAHAEIIQLKSRVYGGELYKNEHRTGSACYVQFNEVIPNFTKGKHCYDLNVQMMFGLESAGVHSKEMKILLQSRKTNTDLEINRPTTCAEVVGSVARPWEVDRWSSDTALLYNQVFANEYSVNKGTNHYIVNFGSTTKEPVRAMIHRLTWLKENSYECRNLMAM